ncbi:MAG TPA: tetratricopeptide repeat protein [Nevskiaceae bacterium]|nr:tetratricopeptide repeat protein [Nevskiaceae bacterium]
MSSPQALPRDIRDTPVSCRDAQALAAYEQALREYQSYVGDAVATIDQALAARPDFVLGHAFRAGVLMTFGERRFARMAAESVAAAERLLEGANARERGLVAAARKLVDGDWHGACAAYDRVLVEHPRDAFAAQTAHLFDFYRGDALNLRNRITRILPHWSADVPGYSFVLGLHAFGLEECNQYAEAEATALRALALEPRDGWAVHAGVHCKEMLGDADAGIAWLHEREAAWAPDNGFAFHNWWHLALFHLDRGEEARVLELLDTRVYPQPSDIALQLVDATALLWRLRLLGVDIGDRFAPLAGAWAAKLDDERDFYAFNDAHAMMAIAATGRWADAERLLAGMGRGFGADVGVPIARGLLEFARERYARAVDLLLPVRDQAWRFGGSHAQRDLVTLTLIEAARRSGQVAMARHYLAERRVSRPHSGLGRRLEARLQ